MNNHQKDKDPKDNANPSFDDRGFFNLPLDTSGETMKALGVQIIPEKEFAELVELVHRNFGIKITEGKRVLVTGRIHPIMTSRNFSTYREYIDVLKNDASGKLLSELVNRISTNHTSFFRESAHFDFMLKAALPEISYRKAKNNDTDLRIWCSACSTGEEAYSLQITLFRYFGINYSRWKAGVLATDISKTVLETASLGQYSAQRLEEVPDDIKRNYFRQIGDDKYEVNKQVRDEVIFRRFNLMSINFPFKKAFDIIFCRNVMIYFDQPTRYGLLQKLFQWTAPGGYLFIGHSESIMESDIGYKYVQPAIYKKEATI